MLKYMRPGMAFRPKLHRARRQHLRAGNEARDRKSWGEAAQAYQRYLAEVPADARIWTQLGHALKEGGDLSGGEAAYRTGLAFAPQDAELHLQLGHVLKLQGRLAEAERAYVRSSELDSTLGAEAELNWRGDGAAPEAPHFLTTGGAHALPAAHSLPRSAASLPHPEAGEVQKLNPSSQRRRGDLARDRRLWRDAVLHYRAYLDAMGQDAAVWVQYGHALKEAGSVPQAEAAYRAALALAPDDADGHLQLGHALKLQGKRDQAVQCYWRSLALQPTRQAVVELRATGQRVELEDIQPAAGTGDRIYLEISDLITTMREYATVSGIQRVQLGLLNHVLSLDQDAGYEVVYWADGLLWSVEPAALRETTHLYNAAIGMENRRELVSRALSQAWPVRPGASDTFVITGAIWMRRDAVVDHERIKRTGTRLGAYIYDFIPLTNPEYCHPYLTERFSNTMAELMLQLDFALTISDFVGAELRRMRQQSGYPAIPVQTVKLAHALDPVQTMPGLAWTGKIAGLEGKAFVLCVGSLAAHKNHIYALQVWRLLLERGIEPPILVLAGKRGYGIEDLTQQLKASHNLGGRIRIIEGLDDAALATLYEACLFTLFPSFVEGWGLPVGESLAHGKVCVASTTTAIPEVGGEFILGIDPYNSRGGADVIANLLSNPEELRRREEQIRVGFQPRSWNDFGKAFLATLRNTGTAGQHGLVLQPLEMLQPRSPPTAWSHGTALPILGGYRTEVLSRAALVSGWFPGEDWGCWMDGAGATVSFTASCGAGSAIQVVMQLKSVFWPRQNRLTVTAAGGKSTALSVPSGPHDFLIQFNTTVPADGRIDLTLALSGVVGPGGGETRTLGVGLRRLLYLVRDGRSERIPAGALVQPRSLTGIGGGAAVPNSCDALVEAARRQAVLAKGWLIPEGWGAWIDGDAAEIEVPSTVQAGEEVRVAVRLRSTATVPGVLTVCIPGSPASTVTLRKGELQDVFATVSGRAGDKGLITVRLAVSPARVRIGLCAAAWGRADSGDDRTAMMEAVLYGSSGQAPDDRELLSRNIGFTVAGHMRGSYSLASVNRRLALTLDAALPGRVRIVQVEGQPVDDLDDMPSEEQARLAALAKGGAADDGPQVVISQHWPVWRPQAPGDLALAYVFWEESVVPPEMVRTLNAGFDGILVPARSVAKSLIDSGVRLPVRIIGFSPDLGSYHGLGAAKGAVGRQAVRKSSPFTFLHISSCFPRKGVDILIAAYSKAFTSRDPVRLIIKGFPNPHNDVGEQLARVRDAHADLAPIEFIDRDLETGALLDLYRVADAMVLPTRGEGFNIPAAEALAAGVALITTAFGAQTDFTGDGLARWVDYRFTYSRSHLRTSNSVWAEPDVDDLASALQEAARQSSAKAGAIGTTAAAGRDRAALLGDRSRWAERVKAVSAELLAMPQAPTPRIAWVSTWKIRCGIGEYSRMLLSAFPHAARDVTVLCDARTSFADLSGAGPAAHPAWRRIDPSSMEELAAAIGQTGAEVVVIQHHHALIRWDSLATLLEDSRVRQRTVVVTMHNTQELLEADPAAQQHLVAALKGVSRVLVHTIADLNLLKGQGLVDNVTMFPHGAPTGDQPIHSARHLGPHDDVLVGAYGFFLQHKGFYNLIEAFGMLRTAFPRVRLRLVTAEYPVPESAQEVERCRALATSLGLDAAIEWNLKYLPDDKSLALLHDCDLIVLPYQHTPESSSAAVRSALASGVPVVVTPLSIFEELQGAVLRLKGVDVQSIAGGMNWILQRQAVRQDLATNGAAWLADNSWANVAERLGGLLQGLVAAEEASPLPSM